MGMRLLPALLGVAALISVIGGTAISVANDREPEAAIEPIVVPAWSYGDELRFSNTAGEQTRHWRVEGPLGVNDSAGIPRQTVRLAVGSGDVTIDADSDQPNVQLYYFDLTTRDIVMSNSPEAIWGGKVPMEGASNSIRLGPGLPIATGIEKGAWLSAIVQGRPLQVGDDLTELALRHGSPSLAKGETFSLSVRVVGEGSWQSERAVAILVEHNWTGLMTAPDGVRTTEWSKRTYWFTESVPAAVRVETLAPGHGLLELTLFKPGHALVKWLGDANPQPAPARGTPVAALYPPSGQGFRGFYRLEEALASVANDSSLTDFSAWKARNPGYRLVGFDLFPDQRVPLAGPAATALFQLRFSAPSGDTLALVDSTKIGPALIRNEWVEEKMVPRGMRFGPSWVPEKFVPFAEADAYWGRVVDSNVYQSGPNVMSWGYPMGYPGPWNTDGGSRPFYPTYLPENFRVVGYGRYSGTVWAFLPSTFDAVYMDASDGSLHHAELMTQQPSATRLTAEWVTDPSADAAPAPARNRVDYLPSLGTAAAGLTFVALLAYLYPLAHEGLVSLYSKLRKHKLLDHALRDQLFSLVRATPGISAPKLKKATGAGWSTVIHHLRILLDANLIATSRVGRHRAYFPAGLIDHGKLPAAVILSNPSTKSVLDLITAQPGIDRVAIAQLLGWTPSGALWHVERLHRCGLVRAEGRKPVRYFSSSPPTQALLQAVLVPA